MGEKEDNDLVVNNTKTSIDMNESTDAIGTKTIFYGVYIPADVQVQETDLFMNVFDNKVEALKLVKKYKKARFKAFDYSKDAVEFAENGSEYPNTVVEVVKNGDSPSVGEKHSPFRGPTSQNLVKLRKGIETGDVDFVQKTIWDNPRYLIGAGDTPSILQEGFRYNALHVAAKAKNPIMCELILNTISNIKFIKKLYVDDKEPEERAKILLDLYLNTPDKGLNETPLHFAVKFGAPKCVAVFVSFPQCDKNLRNKHGNLPKEIICDRYDGPDAKIFSEEIAGLLEDNFYVPVLRSEDNCAPPIIGTPFSPTSPPNFNQDPLSPRMEIHAYAGPMNKEGAERFRKMMKTPPRILNFGSPLRTPATIASLKLKDHEKGLERLGNNLARKMDVPWKEYWPFLDSFVDLASEDGLRQFENYLAEKMAAKYNCDTPSPTTSATPPSRHSGVGKLPCFTEHTSLADQMASNRSAECSPLTELCRALQACKLNDNSYYSPNNNHSHSNINGGYTNGVCAMNNNGNPIHLRDSETMNGHESLSLTLNPTLCIEKSLQVFAKRISNDIIYLIDAESETCTLIETQVKQLQLLMVSYRCDKRFETVDISIAHSRLAYLIKAQLSKYLHDMSAKGVMERLASWLDFSGTHGDCFSSDDESAQGGNSPMHSKSQHTICLLKCLREFLSSDCVHEDIVSETQCVDVWNHMKPCGCTWECKTKKQNGSKRLHLKNKFASLVLHDIPRKLSFEENNPDAVITYGNSDTSSSEEIDDDTDEMYYTPPGTPSLLEDDQDDDDMFHETQLPDDDIYIEGDIPTKIDYAAFNALKYAEADLNSKDYPNICRWHHAVGMYNEKERVSWASPSVVKYNIGSPSVTSTPVSHRTNRGNQTAKDILSSSPPYTPPQSWLRVTGANSPRASLKLQRGNASFNI